MAGMVERAEAIATLLRQDEDLDADPPVVQIQASTSIRDTVPPCLLVVPVPTLSYSSTLEGSQVEDVEWTLYALAPPPADLEAARELELLVDHVAAVLEVDRAEPVGYTIPSTETIVPAYKITVTEPA